MTIQLAILCDAATDYNGKLSLLGSFDTIFAAQFPAVHPQCAVALRIVFTNIEEGPHKIRMSFVDEDGKPIMSNLDIPVEIKMPEDVSFVSRNFILNMQQLKFEKPGLYSIDVALDGRQEISIPLCIKQMSNRPAAD